MSCPPPTGTSPGHLLCPLLKLPRPSWLYSPGDCPAVEVLPSESPLGTEWTELGSVSSATTTARERGRTCGCSGTRWVGGTWAVSGGVVDRTGWVLGLTGSSGELGTVGEGTRSAVPDAGKGKAPSGLALSGVTSASGMRFSSGLAPASASSSSWTGRLGPVGAVVDGASNRWRPPAVSCFVPAICFSSSLLSSVTLLALACTGAGGPRAVAAVGLGRATGQGLAFRVDRG